MTKASNDLADALAHEASVDRGGYVDRTELRTLAREAEVMGAKRALEEAADDYGYSVHPDMWLRARAEQIGKDSDA